MIEFLYKENTKNNEKILKILNKINNCILEEEVEELLSKLNYLHTKRRIINELIINFREDKKDD